MLRAILSASIFGTIGAFIGRWLGHHGNDPTSNLAEPMTKWAMGIFCGTLAAYSSFKASERSEREEGEEAALRETDKHARSEPHMPPQNTAGDTPTTTAQATSAMNEGKVVMSTPHMAL